MNTYPNCKVFYSLDSSWSLLSKSLKSLTSHLNSSSDLMEFEEYLKNFLIVRRFDPYSSLYYLILKYNLKLVSLEKKLTHLCLFSMTSPIHHRRSSSFGVILGDQQQIVRRCLSLVEPWNVLIRKWIELISFQVGFPYLITRHHPTLCSSKIWCKSIR